MSMTREQKEAVLIGFYLRGKKVQCAESGTQEWMNITKPEWIFDVYDYRFEPEPVVGWFVIDKSGLLSMPMKDVNEAIREKKRWDSIEINQDNRIIYMRECDPPEEGK